MSAILTNFQKEIAAFTAQVQELEDAAYEVYKVRFIDAALQFGIDKNFPANVNGILDDIGDRVGCIRPLQMSNADYAVLLHAQVAMNAGGATPGQLTAALKVLTGATVVNYHECYPHTVWIEFAATSAPANLYTYMKAMVAGGVGLVLVMIDPTLPFYFDSSTNGLDNGLLGALIT